MSYFTINSVKHDMDECISFQEKDNYDKIIVDAWLNKSKNRIVKEIKSLSEDYKK